MAKVVKSIRTDGPKWAVVEKLAQSEGVRTNTLMETIMDEGIEKRGGVVPESAPAVVVEPKAPKPPRAPKAAKIKAERAVKAPAKPKEPKAAPKTAAIESQPTVTIRSVTVDAPSVASRVSVPLGDQRKPMQKMAKADARSKWK